MSDSIQFEAVEPMVLSTPGEYQKVFEHCKTTLEGLGGKIKKEDAKLGILEAAWKYGINPFGLRGTINFRTSSDGAILLTIRAGFKDSFNTTGAPEKKAKEIMHALVGANSEVQDTLSPPSMDSAPITSNRNKTKTLMAILALLLGGAGGHKFYSGCWGWGIVYLVTCFILPGVSSLVALVEFIRILTLSTQDFDSKYNSSTPKPFDFIW